MTYTVIIQKFMAVWEREIHAITFNMYSTCNTDNEDNNETHNETIRATKQQRESKETGASEQTIKLVPVR